MNAIWIGFFGSFKEIIRHILTGHSPEVLFYYPQHFNRSSEGSNPYFDTILSTCQDAGINFLLLEEPDLETTNPRNRQAVRADALFWTVTLMRKCLRWLCPRSSDTWRDLWIARLLDFITLHKFKSRSYVTISNSMSDFLAGLNPKGTVYDLQHGIIYARHPGYFDQTGLLRAALQPPNKHFLVWGDLFRRCFSWNPNNKVWLKDKVHVVGYPILSQTQEPDRSDRKKILYSLQFTHDYDSTMLKNLLDMLDQSLKCWRNSGYVVLLKNHPRFNNAINLCDIFRKYSFVRETSLPLEKLASQIKLHITYNSTTCFEYARYSVPTFFLCDKRYEQAKEIFYSQYEYPLYKDMTLLSIIERISDNQTYAEDCSRVKTWYESAFAPFDREIILKLFHSREN